jgi:hypothetical protein
MKLTSEKKQKFLLTLIVVIGVVYGVYYLLISMGFQKQKVENQKTLTTTKDAVSKFKKQIDTEKSNRVKAKSYQAYIPACEAGMPKGSSEETWLLKTLSELAHEFKIKIMDTKVEPMDELSAIKFPSQPYELIGFRFKFTGEYDQIGEFIEYLENNMPLLEVDSISIDSGSEAAVFIHSVSLRISMVIKK